MDLRVSVTALVAAVAIAALGWLAPGPRRVNIRWAESVTLSERINTERSLGLRNNRPEGERTWSYDVPDASVIPRLSSNPLIVETHHINRDEGVFSPEFPSGRARIRRLYDGSALRVIRLRWPAISGFLLIVAIVAGAARLRRTLALAPHRLLVPAILVSALIARMTIILSGGQFYWPDEGRYLQSRIMVEDMKAGVALRAWQFEHPLFNVVGMLPAAIESTYLLDPRIPAAFFSLFSLLNIWLLAGISRRLGAGPAESTLVTLLFAASTSFLYFARHLFPYDVSMTFGLLALRAAITSAAPRASLVCGAWAGLCFLTYFGYWTFGGAACVIHVFQKLDGKTLIRRSAATAVGLAIPLLFIVGAPSASGGDVITGTMTFMGNVNQGVFAEGWRVPVAYLWHAEHGLLLLWIAATAVCVVAWRRYLQAPAVRVGLIGLVFIYAALAVLSTEFEMFVVYGRLARQLVPFFCLITGAVLARLLARTLFQRALLTAVGLMLVIQAAINAKPVLAQQFPPQFIQRGEQLAGGLGASRAVPLYAAHLYPPTIVEPPAGLVEVFSASHPLQYVPYQYEGFTPQERHVLRSADIRMRMLIPAPSD